MAKTEQPGFICPKCGGLPFGTSDMDKPPSEWLAHCHTPDCGWSGLHAEHVFPMRFRADVLESRGFTPGDAEKVERFARKLFFGDRLPLPAEMPDAD